MSRSARHVIPRGFTLTELGALIVTAAVAGAVWLAVQPESKPGAPPDAAMANRQRAREIKDSIQIRDILSACATWAQSGNDEYPMPSRIDRLNVTVNESGKAKDTSANIMSFLITTGFVPADMLVSPLERNPAIKPCEAYEYDMPRAAVKPEQALWDPAFNVDFTGGKTGSLSYAHAQPSGARRLKWANTFTSTEPAVAMRGPEVKSVIQIENGSVTPAFANEKSLTFGLYGKGTPAAWSGNVGYNDCHVEFVRDALEPGKNVAAPKPAPAEPPRITKGMTWPKEDRAYAGGGGRNWPDLMFYDEPDDPKSVNDYLGIFIKAGETPKDFTAIWD